jgi:ferrous iron transport protein B
MLLSNLKTGEEGSIISVKGRGAFRRRIMEMGFVRGEQIKVIKNAPLKDPIEYSLMGYHVSLRRSEAELIEIGTQKSSHVNRIQSKNGEIAVSEKRLRSVKGNTINIAFVGNPNAGKTSLFNFASNSNEHTGNYSGVTIDSKTARLLQDGYLFNLTDLPGTYSVSAFSPEELFVRDFIIEKIPDVVVNVVDVSNLERNLYLSTQLIDMDIKVVMALNMYDEFEKRGDELNVQLLGKLLGIPIIPTVGSKGKGIKELIQKVIDVYNDKDPDQRHIHISYGEEIEYSIKKLQSLIKIPENYSLTDRISSRFISIKLLEHDRTIERYIKNISNYNQIIEATEKERKRIDLLFGGDASSIVTNEKYGFIAGALRETYQRNSKDPNESTRVIDSFLTNKVLGFPFFILFMWVMFSATFELGNYPKQWLESGVGLLGNWLSNTLAAGSLKDLLIDGIIGGVGGVIVFLPNILILFLFISIMEDSGYMARAVFIMDKLMHKIGLHGKSFIPLIMGFGCNVPAIMATRTIEDKNNKLLTMLINPFMSCSARLPVYLLLIGAIFPKYQGTLLFMLYFLGILLAICVALIFKKVFFRSESAPFVMELPPYRMPTARSTLKHMWFKGSQYLSKMGGVILVASVLLWALSYFPRNPDDKLAKKESGVEYNKKLNPGQTEIMKILPVAAPEPVMHSTVENEMQQLENSYIGRMGKFIEPALHPLGFNWKMGVSLLSGIAAKEIIVSTLGVLHHEEIHDTNTNEALSKKLQNEKYTSGTEKGKSVFNPLSTLSYLLFILIYFPCIAVFAAVKRESGSIKWALFMVFYTTALAYIISLLVFQTGSFILTF